MLYTLTDPNNFYCGQDVVVTGVPNDLPMYRSVRLVEGHDSFFVEPRHLEPNLQPFDIIPLPPLEER